MSPPTAQDDQAPRFACDAGDVVGWRDDGVLRATGIRYARAERYAAPVAEPPAPEPIEATSWAPGCPQAGSRLLERMFPLGFGDIAEDEHCQRLSVTMPADVDLSAGGERLPVMVFLHGGSYVNGAGDAPIHDPRALVSDERVVAVNVTYRLGLFGYLGHASPAGAAPAPPRRRARGPADVRKTPSLPSRRRLAITPPGRRSHPPQPESHTRGADGRPANLGLLDQAEALRWVQRNIAAYGGDPDNVTAFGESAGADAVLHLMVADGARGLFRRAIVQSAPLGITRGREAMAAAMAQEAADIPHDASAAEVVSHYPRVSGRARPFGLVSGMPFGVQYGHAPMPREDDLAAAWADAAPDVEVLIGTNHRETSFFVTEVPVLERLAALPVVGGVLLEAVVRATTWRIYGRDARRFVRSHRRAGGRAARYTISWGPRATGLAGAHTIDLALLFPQRSVWEASPVTAGLDWSEIEAAGRPVRRAWAEFARSGRVLDEGCPHLTIHT